MLNRSLPLSGGFAPWPAETSPEVCKATAQDIRKLATVFVAAVLFAGVVVVARAALDVALSSPPASLSPAYSGQGAGGAFVRIGSRN